MVDGFENLGRDLSPKLLDLKLIEPVLLILLLDLLGDLSELCLEGFDRFLLALHLLLQLFLFQNLFLFCQAELIIKLL